MGLLSDTETARLVPASAADSPTPVPVRVVSSDEFLPIPQTERQKQVEARLNAELGGIEERRTREVAKMAQDKGLKPITVMTFNNFAEAFQALKAGQSDAATSIDATAMFMQQRGDFTRAISGVFPQTACFAFANKALADAVVGALNDLKKDGVYDKLLDQYGVLKMDGSTFAISGPGPA